MSAQLENITFIKVPKEVRDQCGVDLASVLLENKLVKSKNEARKAIKAGIIALNDIKVVDPFAHIMIHNEYGWLCLQENQ